MENFALIENAIMYGIMVIILILEILLLAMDPIHNRRKPLAGTIAGLAFIAALVYALKFSTAVDPRIRWFDASVGLVFAGIIIIMLVKMTQWRQ